MDDSSIFDQYQ